jgi:hypothetical protein
MRHFSPRSPYWTTDAVIAVSCIAVAAFIVWQVV